MITLTMSSIISNVNGHFFDLLDFVSYIALNIPQLLDKLSIALNQQQIKILESCIDCRNLYKQLKDVILKTVIVRPKYMLKADICITFDGTPAPKEFILCNKFIGLICSRLNLTTVKANSIYLLMDKSVYTDSFLKQSLLYRFGGSYEQLFQPNIKIVDYKKKIYFHVLDYEPVDEKYQYMYYITKGWKDVDEFPFHKNSIIFTDCPKDYWSIPYIRVPVKDMFTYFNTYVYLGTKHNFDCSNRLVKECQYLKKNIVIHKQTYGLDVRLQDPLERVKLDNDDLLFHLIG